MLEKVRITDINSGLNPDIEKNGFNLKKRKRRKRAEVEETLVTPQTACRRDGAASAPPLSHLFAHFLTAQRSRALPRREEG